MISNVQLTDRAGYSEIILALDTFNLTRIYLHGWQIL